MRLIKLDAIGSTNDFLKEMANEGPVENYTVVTAENQTSGRGQMGATWHTQKGKNLIMSVLVKNPVADLSTIFSLNIAVSLAVVAALRQFNIKSIQIKWPNDIMAENKKIGGILIENLIKTDGSVTSIIGIGLNVNQTDFDGLPKASSLAVFTGKEFDRELILRGVVEQIEVHVANLSVDMPIQREKYVDLLFKKDVPMPFKDTAHTFMGMVSGIAEDGRLLIKHDDDSIKSYDLKQVEMLY